MSGKIRQRIDQLVQAKSKGTQAIVHATYALLMLKGINVTSYNEQSDDDQTILEKLNIVAKDWGLE